MTEKPGERGARSAGTNAELLETILGRPLAVPLPPKDAPVETWKMFSRELERQDLEAFKILRPLFRYGRQTLEEVSERTGGEK